MIDMIVACFNALSIISDKTIFNNFTSKQQQSICERPCMDDMLVLRNILSNVFDTIFCYLITMLALHTLYPMLNAEMLRALSA